MSSVIRPRRLPGLVLVLVLAFAETEGGLCAAMGICRGFASEVSVRWPTGMIVASEDNKAVLLWSCQRSRAPLTRAQRNRRIRSVVVAVAIGVALFLLTNALLLVPLTFALRLLGTGAAARAEMRLCVIGVRLSLTGARAVGAYRHDRRLDAVAPPTGAPRWSLDHLASLGGGRGGELLSAWLRTADRDGVEVLLHCPRELQGFYAGHGFVTCPGSPPSQAVMLRVAASG